MAEAITKTKEMINPRVEIDTSPPFESVKEAVSLFSGRATWNHPHHFLPLHDYQNTAEVFEVDKMEEEAAQFERLLITRERETLNVLRELEEGKTLVEGLKASLMQGQNSMLSLSNGAPPGSVFMNFDKTTTTLNKTTIDLAVIRSSVESLNKIMSQDKGVLEDRSTAKVPNSAAEFSAMDKEDIKIRPDNSFGVSYAHPQFSFEAELVEASKYEIMKAMAEIERTKVSIRMAEMRLNAAKKIEEAAEAVEAIAFSETKALLNGKNSLESHLHKPEEINLPFEEYCAISHRAKQEHEICKTKFIDANGKYMNNEASQYPESVLSKLDQTIKNTCNELLDDGFSIESSEYDIIQDAGHGSVKCKFIDSNCGYERLCHPSTRKDSFLLSKDEPNIAEDKTTPVYRSKISIGEILSRKLKARGERQQRSLTQLLRERSGHMLQRAKSMKIGSVAQKKKFGFIHVSLSKHKQNKSKVLN